MTTAVLEEPAVRRSVWIDPDSRFEIIDGREVEVPPMSAYSNEVGNRIFRRLSVFLDQNEIGEAQLGALFHLKLPKDRSRIPDVAFISYERWPKNRPFPYRGNLRDVVPELTVEVVSPNDGIEELMTKLDEYFRAGVRLVWIVHCNLRQVYVYQSLTSIRVLTETEELEGGDVLPGFRTPIGRLFPAVLLEETPPADQ